MKAKDFRIGNYLQDDKHKLCMVEGVSVDGLDAPAMVGGLTYLPVNPIPLTELWLKKFGFENWGNKVCNEFESYTRWVKHNCIEGTSNYEVHIIESNYGGMHHVETVYSIDDDERQWIKETDFVHNLQNAFYFATGVELHTGA